MLAISFLTDKREIHQMMRGRDNDAGHQQRCLSRAISCWYHIPTPFSSHKLSLFYILSYTLST